MKHPRNLKSSREVNEWLDLQLRATLASLMLSKRPSYPHACIADV